MDILIIQGIGLSIKIGANKWEQQYPQKVLISLEIALVNNKYIDTDSVNDTINYVKVVNDIRDRYASLSFILIESLANDIANFLMREYLIKWIKVCVEKPAILSNVQKVAVIINKSTTN